MSIPRPAEADPIRTDEQLMIRVRELVQRAFRRELWLFLADDEHRQLPVLPRVEVPREPDAFAVDHLMDRLGELAAEAGARELALVYERPGPERLAAADRRWLRILATTGTHGVAVRGPLLAHSRGVRWIGAEDLDDPPP